MTLLSQIAGTVARLPRVTTPRLTVSRDLAVPMPDGVVLLADLYQPHRGQPLPPTVLVRSPYGRSGFFGFLYGRLLAERGYQVLVQSVRGTFGSGGTFDPYVNEHTDGLSTVAWIRQQPWFNGTLATCGPSYLGYTQWAIAAEADLQAISIQVSTSNFHDRVYAGDSFGLWNALNWTTGIVAQEKASGRATRLRETRRRLPAILSHLPLRDLDELATGHHVFFYQDWLEHTEGDSEYWQRRNFLPTLPQISAPICLVGGWYDIFLPWQLRDYSVLRSAGQHPYLTIGPWGHSSFGVLAASVRESLDWFDAQLKDDHARLRRLPVRIFVSGAGEWREFPDWPPESARTASRLYLQPYGGLASSLPPPSSPDHYRYDPSDPTPSVAGPHLSRNSTPTDNRDLEARPDVLTYTTAPLPEDLLVIGSVEADLFVSSSLEHADFFARLCDVDRRGRSINVCDALQRVRPDAPTASAGSHHLTFALWPTAHLFRRGHRLRLQVSSGAHPRYARNTGSGEPLATATTLVVAEQSIFHDPEHPSAVVLSVPTHTST